MVWQAQAERWCTIRNRGPIGRPSVSCSVKRGHEKPLNRQLARVRSLGESHVDDDALRASPAERLGMVWQITVDAWAFKGENVAESRLPRHTVRVLRREG